MAQVIPSLSPLADDIGSGAPPGIASEETLMAWATLAIGAPIAGWHRISGGNRYQSFVIETQAQPGADAWRYYLRYQLPRPATVEPYTVLREIEFYKLLEASDVPAARLIAINPDLPAVVLEYVEGIAEYRRLTDPAERETIAFEFVEALAALHRLPVSAEQLPDSEGRTGMKACARQEVATWRAMYEEMPDRSPLIDLSLDWLEANVPDEDGAPVLVHGDAGPGNFLFKDGHLSAVIDWEFAHLGDPHDDLAWFSMRCVMEPVPDFAACLRHYEARTGLPVDLARLHYYRVLVSTRVLIVRHRNVSGEYGNSIVSQALNQRLLTSALIAANGFAMPDLTLSEAPPTSRGELYDFIIDGLRDDISARTSDRKIVSSAKMLAKVGKFLREVDRYGPEFDREEMADLTRVLGHEPVDQASGRQELTAQVRDGRITLAEALSFFAGSAHRSAQLAASASGRISGRTWPPIG